MENSRKLIIEQDIKDLLKKIQGERQSRKLKRALKDENGFTTKLFPGLEEKNYSDYSKLINSLFNLLDSCKKISTDNQFSYVFGNDIIQELNSEIDKVHMLMKESLDRDNSDQYRCLNDIYAKLIGLTNFVEKYIGKEEVLSTKNMEAISELMKRVPNLLPNHIPIFTQNSEARGKDTTKKCIHCGKEKILRKFNILNGNELNWCKDCSENYTVRDTFDFIHYLQENDVAFYYNLWVESKENLLEYYKLLSIAQDIDKTFKGSIFG